MKEKPSSESRSTRAFYDRISRSYDLLAEASEHQSRERGLELLDVRPGERVLEIGFGTGHGLVSLAEAVGPEGTVVGIDVSEGMREVARERLEESGLAERARSLDLGDARDLPYDDASFDAVFLSFTLELFEEGDLERVLGECRRVLAPGGRLGVVSLEHEESTSLLVDLYKWLHRHFPHIADCRPIPVIDLVAASGFRIERRVGMSIWSLPVAAVVASTEGMG